jgi:hypothetical protein
MSKVASRRLPMRSQKNAAAIGAQKIKKKRKPGHCGPVQFAGMGPAATFQRG